MGRSAAEAIENLSDSVDWVTSSIDCNQAPKEVGNEQSSFLPAWQVTGWRVEQEDRISSRQTEPSNIFS